MLLTLPESPATKAFLARFAALVRSMALLRKNTLRVLRHAWVQADGGALRIRMTDMEQAVELTAPCEIGTGLPPVLLPLEDLLPLLKGASSLVREAMPDQDGVSRLSLRTNRSQASLRTQPVKDYPVLFEDLGKMSRVAGPSFDASFLTLPVLEFAAHAASRDATKPALSSLFLELSGAGKATLASTDGWRLAVAETAKAVAPAGPEATLLLPRVYLPSLKILLDREGPVQAVFGDLFDSHRPGRKTSEGVVEPWIEVRTPGATLWLRGQQGNYPQWRRVLPSLDSLPSALAFDRKTLLATVEAASRFQDDYNKNLRLFPKGGSFSPGAPELNFVFQHPDRGTCEASLSLLPHPKGTAGFTDAAFNCLYLRDLAKVALSGTVTAHLKDGVGQWLWQASDPGAAVTASLILMPVRYAAPWQAPSTEPKDAKTSAPEPGEGPAASAAVSAQPEAPEALEGAPAAPHGAVPAPVEPALPIPEMATVYRADHAAIQALGGLRAMRSYKPTAWHRYGEGSRATAWAVPASVLSDLGLTPLPQDQARKAHLDHLARKSERREKRLAKVG